MDNNSFDSLNLDVLTLYVIDFFYNQINYDTFSIFNFLIGKKNKREYYVFRGIIKNFTQAIKIYERIFNCNAISKQRFRILATDFHQGSIFADNMFLDCKITNWK